MIKIELSKYPVIHNGNEYRVDVVKDHIALGSYQWKVNIYKFVLKKTLPFGCAKYKWKTVYTYTTGWSKYRKWLGKYIELAELAVTRYEESIESDIKTRELNNQGIKRWNEWDGKIGDYYDM